MLDRDSYVPEIWEQEDTYFDTIDLLDGINVGINVHGEIYVEGGSKFKDIRRV